MVVLATSASLSLQAVDASGAVIDDAVVSRK
jgi:hypothetical protein